MESKQESRGVKRKTRRIRARGKRLKRAKEFIRNKVQEENIDSRVLVVWRYTSSIVLNWTLLLRKFCRKIKNTIHEFIRHLGFNI